MPLSFYWVGTRGPRGTDLIISQIITQMSHISHTQVTHTHTNHTQSYIVTYTYYKRQNHQKKLTPNDDSRKPKSGIDTSYKKGGG